MAFLNEDAPVFYCKVRAEYLYDLQSHHGEYEDAVVFGLASVYGRALGFHLITEQGAQIARLPISALVHKEHDPHLPLHYLQLWDCYDAETEVLTKNGWKKFPQLSYTDELATVNLNTDRLEYQMPSNLISKWYEGEMVHIGGGNRQKLDLFVTPSHRMVVHKTKKNIPEIRCAKDLRKTDRIKLTAKWEGDELQTIHIPAAGQSPIREVDAVALAKFLGWYIAEGCCQEKAHRVFISQIPGPGRDRLLKDLEHLPWKWHNTGNSIAVSSMQVYGLVKDLGDSCYNKRVPQWIKEASPRIIRAFLDGAVAGDGWHDGPRERYATVSPLLADDIQELYFKLGKHANIRHRKAQPYDIRGQQGTNTSDQYWVIQNSGQFGSLIADGCPIFSSKEYSGMVYCATVPNGTLVVRRNGKMSICGNCFSYQFSVKQFGYLELMRCKAILRDRQIFDGSYQFTVDWCGNNDSEDPGEGGHKNAHIVALDCGCFAALPNNRLIFKEPSFLTDTVDIDQGERPEYLTNSHVWKCEIDDKWCTENSYKMFYEDQNADNLNLSREQLKELTRLAALKDSNWPDIEDEIEKWKKNNGL